MKKLPGPEKVHTLKRVGDAGTPHLDEPDEAAGPGLEVLGLASEGWAGRTCPSTWNSKVGAAARNVVQWVVGSARAEGH
eukprot:3883676-Alexandrium_andersonii.AAC.1